MRAVAWQICQRISIGNSCNPDEQRSSSPWYWIINNLVAIPTTTYHLHHHTIISVFKKAVKYFFILFTGLFLSFFYRKMVSPLLEFAQIKFWIKHTVWNIGIHPVLNLDAVNEDQRGAGANISLYTVYLLLIWN